MFRRLVAVPLLLLATAPIAAVAAPALDAPLSLLGAEGRNARAVVRAHSVVFTDEIAGRAAPEGHLLAILRLSVENRMTQLWKTRGVQQAALPLERDAFTLVAGPHRLQAVEGYPVPQAAYRKVRVPADGDRVWAGTLVFEVPGPTPPSFARLQLADPEGGIELPLYGVEATDDGYRIGVVVQGVDGVPLAGTTAVTLEPVSGGTAIEARRSADEPVHYLVAPAGRYRLKASSSARTELVQEVQLDPGQRVQDGWLRVTLSGPMPKAIMLPDGEPNLAAVRQLVGRIRYANNECDPAALGRTLATPQAALAFVREHTRLIPALGRGRGALGTLRARAGSSDDRAALLATMLTAQGHQVRFAYQDLTEEEATALYQQASPERPIAAPSEELAKVLDGIRGRAREDAARTMELLGAQLPQTLPGKLPQRYVWVQWRDGRAWQDLDPRGAAGTSPKEADGTLRNLEAAGWPVLFQVLQRSTGEEAEDVELVRYETEAARLVTEALAVELRDELARAASSPGFGMGSGGGPGGALTGGPRAKEGAHTFRAMLYPLRDGSLGVRPGKTFDGKETERVWVRVTLTDPAGQTHVHERSLFDRQRPGEPEPTRQLAQTELGRMLVLSCQYGEAGPDRLRRRTEAALDYHPAMAEMGLLATHSLYGWLRAAASPETAGVSVEPTLVLSLVDPILTPEMMHLRVHMDLLRPPVRSPLVGWEDRLYQGYLDVAIEALVMQWTSEGVAQAPTDAVLPEEVSMVAPDKLPAGLPGGATHWMERALADGHLVLAPTPSGPSYRFWSVDPQSGRFVDTTEQGMHNNASESSVKHKTVTQMGQQAYKCLSNATAAALLTAMITVAPIGGTIGSAVGPIPGVTWAELVEAVAQAPGDRKKVLEELFEKLGKGCKRR